VFIVIGHTVEYLKVHGTHAWITGVKNDTPYLKTTLMKIVFDQGAPWGLSMIHKTMALTTSYK
jgi:hypothetical protein